MGLSQSKSLKHFRERNRSQVIDLRNSSASRANDLAIESNNSNVNEVSGAANIANNNANINVCSGAFVHYAPANYFYAPGPDPSDVTQLTIAAALQERYVPEAVYGAQPDEGCMDGTRVQVLQDIENWIRNPEAPQIFWLAGMAGTGKTAIAQTVCSRVHEHAEVMLGGSFFCSRSTGSAAQRKVRCIVPTLARLLARKSIKFGEALAAELTNDPEIPNHRVSEQVKRLLYKPLIAVKDSHVPIVFVIDALDECGGKPTAGEAPNTDSDRMVSELLTALVDLSRSSVKLPVKFLVTSRPETHIRDTPVSDITFSTILHLHTVGTEQVTSDIRLYISTRLFSSPKLRARFTADDADLLARLSDGLFIVATTALKYALGEGIDAAASRFKTLLNSARDGLSSGAAVPLDSMYSLILMDTARVGQVHADELNALLQLLASLLSAQMALSVAALADILDQDKDEVRARLSRLHAVVYVPDDDDEPSLRVLHASFGDYLFHRAPSAISISQSLGHVIMARGCLHFMAKYLHFNVSQSQSSYHTNPATKPGTITLPLEYACLQWIYHVSGLPSVSSLEEDIHNIFRAKFLFWLEVMSVLGQVRRAIAMLVFAAGMVRLAPLARFLRDANAFVASSREAIERSAPHIYLSALPFAAKDSLVYQTFFPLCTGLIAVETFGVHRHGGRLIMTLTGHEAGVTSVEYSLDGCLISSGSRDGTVRIWDTRNGEEIMPPLHSGDGAVRSVAFAAAGQCLATGTEEGRVCIWSLLTGQGSLQRLSGHSGPVWSVTFSPNGKLLASASKDKTVRLWQAATGHQIAVLKGHTKAVNAVAFAPNGAILASSSADETIRLWDVVTCIPLTQPLETGSDVSLSICFSPDGTSLAAGGWGGSIQLWDIQTRRVFLTLHGHSDWIRCVKYSTDGVSLVSASDDCTIRLWTISQSPHEASSIVFKGHAGPIRSASFSSDGLYIAAAFKDGNVRIWDASSGQPAVQSLTAHLDSIRSIAVSTCGNLIVSGSDDRSVRVWDTRMAEPQMKPLLGHTRPVYSVTISADKRLIASASCDCTIRLWDARTGDAVGDPLMGHSQGINSVAFSPNSQLIVSGSEDQTVRVWNAATRQPAEGAPLRCDGYVRAVAFSPDGQLIAAGESTGHIRLWRSDTGQPLCEPLPVKNQAIRFINFSPDVTRIVTGGEHCMLSILSINTGKELLSLDGHKEWVSSAVFSPDGQLICSGSMDCTVRLWDSFTGTLIVTLHGHTDWVRSVGFMPDGLSVVSCSDDRTIRVWDVNVARSKFIGSIRNLDTALITATLHNEWLVGPSGELLVWVPSDYHTYLQLPPCTMIFGRRRIAVTIESGGWHRGRSWVSCWRDDILETVARTT